MKSIAVGIGTYGISVITEMLNSNSFETVIAIDSDKSVLESVALDNKISISKRLSARDAVERIKNKLKMMIPDCDVVFLISNPIDLHSPFVITEMVDYIKSLGFLAVALAIEPSGKYDRKQKNQAKKVVEELMLKTATIRIPQKNMQLYCEPNYRWYEWYISKYEYGERDNILEQVEFDNWYKNSTWQEQHVEKDVLVGIFYIQRTLDILNEKYPGTTQEDICRILSNTGAIHIGTAIATYKDISDSFFTVKVSVYEFARTLRRRASFNDIINTSTHNSKGLIFILNVPESATEEEVADICYMLHSFSNESVDSVFTINVIKCQTEVFSVKLLATGSDDLNKSEVEY